MDDKTNISHFSVELQSPAPSDLGCTSHDDHDMSRMGKKQELKRNFRFISIVGFVVILQGTWESALLSNSFGLYNGGTAGVIWMTIAVWLLVLACIASIAEMASIAPTAGGQYHWVSEFAPDSVQQPLSYVVGWMCCLGWVAAIPACGQFFAAIVNGMVLLANPDASDGALWQATLLAIGFIIVTVAFNLFCSKWLPMVETLLLALHTVAFFVFLLVLWISSKHAPAKQVFTEFHDGGGWGNIGLSTLVGIGGPLWTFVGPDSAAHMSEELQDASYQLPRAMIWATLFNGITGTAMLITFCFCIPSIDAVLDSTTGIPVLEVIHTATGSFAAVWVLGLLLIILTYFGTATMIAAVSRQCWAFARDGGFPFSNWIHRVHPRFDIPVNALLFCLGCSLALSCINFGSEVALSAIVSVSNAALVFTYIASIGCIRLKRLRGEALLPRRFDLGRWGGVVNDVSLLFLIISFVFSFFPVAPSVGDPTWAVDFNWAVVVFVGTLLLAAIYYVVGGKNRYVPPVRLVKRE